MDNPLSPGQTLYLSRCNALVDDIANLSDREILDRLSDLYATSVDRSSRACNVTPECIKVLKSIGRTKFFYKGSSLRRALLPSIQRWINVINGIFERSNRESPSKTPEKPLASDTAANGLTEAPEPTDFVETTPSTGVVGRPVGSCAFFKTSNGLRILEDLPDLQNKGLDALVDDILAWFNDNGFSENGAEATRKRIAAVITGTGVFGQTKLHIYAYFEGLRAQSAGPTLSQDESRNLGLRSVRGLGL